MRVTTDQRQCARVCADPDEGAGDTRGRRSGTRRLQIPQADQVRGRGGESELPIDEWDAAMPELAQTTDGLHPPKDLFHEFSFPLTHVITRMPGGPTINRPPADLLRHVGRDVPDADIGDEARHIVALVCSDRAARRRAGLQQQCRRLAFGGPRAWVAQTLATSPCRLSNSRWPRDASFASFPWPFRCSIASGSVVDWCVSLRRRSPWKSTVGFPGSSGGALGAASRHRKLFRLAQASNCVLWVSNSEFGR